MFRIGITGGIGSGKTMVANRFGELGAPIVDADVVARQVVLPGTPACKEIIEAFGDTVANENGELNRAQLRSIVFGNSVARTRLQNIVHPRIFDEIHRQLRALSGDYAIVVIPLLAEARRDYALDRVLVVDAPRKLRISRIVSRDGQTSEAVEQILSSQATREERLAIADDVVNNAGTAEELFKQVDALHRRYLALARNSG